MTKLKKRVRNQKDEDIITISRYKLQAYLWFKRIPTCEEQTNFDKLFEEHETLYRLKSIIQAFQKLLNEQKNEQVLETWLIQAKENEIPEIQQFIKYIRTDIEAVKHALSYSWSNGLVEGHVNRLEVIKRQMYGRAKLDLLSRKVLYQTT
ncbi:transposase [Bacillus sp. DX1.1]|uniref:transposase n=1 Tax=unclassified Bacillus (in: firmicutes) TaxID=185979 RepID=UPI002570AFF1|nr:MULTISPECIES: transposase [unclassified Bacillus (in: firmicutes)]MDM5154429.1 transposase [Bacillus sp. DX1.1]WJE83333.1 transposase [Bacillus sp. DX3.1]